MFPSINNESGIKSVEHLLNTRLIPNPPAFCSRSFETMFAM